MSFKTEPTGYQKTVLSDLQGAWLAFRESVVDSGGFENWDRVLLHTDEAMSWEMVRNLNRMPPLVLIGDIISRLDDKTLSRFNNAIIERAAGGKTGWQPSGPTDEGVAEALAFSPKPPNGLATPIPQRSTIFSGRAAMPFSE